MIIDLVKDIYLKCVPNSHLIYDPVGLWIEVLLLEGLPSPTQGSCTSDSIFYEIH